MDRSIYDQMRALERDHWWFTGRREILAGELSRLKLPPGARILEVGCGTGGNLGMLARFGEVQGVEPDAASRAYAAELSGKTVLAGGLPDGLPAFGRGFDLIAALDVIEHVEADRASLAALGALLAPGGRLITTVPAYSWMWSDHDVLHHHRRRYTLGGCRRLLTAAGLKVRRATYFNTLLFPPIAAVRLARKLARQEGGDDAARVGAGLNRVLHEVFAAERHLLGFTNLPFGVSILAVADRAA
ncbi:MAG: class I SAM-dependent methyltransferase [Phenylobacterium sp.]